MLLGSFTLVFLNIFLCSVYLVFDYYVVWGVWIFFLVLSGILYASCTLTDTPQTSQAGVLCITALAAWNLLCRSGWPWTYSFCFLSTRLDQRVHTTRSSLLHSFRQSLSESGVPQCSGTALSTGTHEHQGSGWLLPCLPFYVGLDSCARPQLQ